MEKQRENPISNCERKWCHLKTIFELLKANIKKYDFSLRKLAFPLHFGKKNFKNIVHFLKMSVFIVKKHAKILKKHWIKLVI